MSTAVIPQVDFPKHEELCLEDKTVTVKSAQVNGTDENESVDDELVPTLATSASDKSAELTDYGMERSLNTVIAAGGGHASGETVEITSCASSDIASDGNIDIACGRADSEHSDAADGDTPTAAEAGTSFDQIDGDIKALREKEAPAIVSKKDLLDKRDQPVLDEGNHKYRQCIILLHVPCIR